MEKNSDDAWNLFNLLSKGDQVFGTCRRKIQKDTLTGLVKQEVRKFNALLRIVKIDYDPELDEIRVLGINIQENKFIGMGAHQAMTIKAPNKLTLIKQTFDSMHEKKLREAAQGTNDGQVLAITLEEGIAHLWLVSKNNTKLKGKIEKTISKKKAFVSKTEKQKGKFMENVENTLEQSFNIKDHGPELLNSIKAVVIGSPGFYKDHLFTFLNEAATRKKSQVLKTLLAKTVLCHCSSGYKSALSEIMQNPQVQKEISTLSCFSENEHLSKFFELLRTEDNMVCYGLNTTKFAIENQAVSTLLISDHLFRSKNISTRKEYVKLSEDSEKQGIKVVVFSSNNPTGNRLKDMTGVAGILRFNLPGLDDVDEADSDSDAQSASESEDNEEEEKKQSFDEQQLDFLMGEGMLDDQVDSADESFISEESKEQSNFKTSASQEGPGFGGWSKKS